MKLFTASLMALGLTLTAQAQQDVSRDAELMTSVDKLDMRYIIESAGYQVNEDLSTGIGLVGQATDEGGLVFGIQGKACDDDSESCLGLETFLILEGEFSAEFADNVNQRWSAIKATTLEGGNLMLSRYLILDHGQNMLNLKVNLDTTYAIAKQVHDEVREEQAGQAQLSADQIAWGDDTGQYANDAACDDARFHPDGDDWDYKRTHVLHDATDCREQYKRGEIVLYVDFGDNSGEYAFDNTCDDNRFTGEGRSILTTDSHVRKDASDCIAAYQTGRLNR